MPDKRYRAFISYSRKDRKWSARLHRWLETYRVPDDLGASLDASRRLGRFFRDDEELPAAANISDHVGRAIADSESLIVICSPHAARSEWVAAEIRLFRRLGSGRKIFTFIVDGEPNAKDPGAECFPEPLRAVDESERSHDLPGGPIGVDVRLDGKHRACARLAAGLLGLSFDDLWQRDRRRSAARQRWLVGGLSAVSMVFATLSVVAIRQGNLARESTRRAEAARANLLSDTSLRLLAEGNGPKAVGYALASLQLARSTPTETEALLRSERAMRQSLISHHMSPTRLEVTYRGHEGRVADVEVSSDGRLLATAGDDGVVRIYDFDSGELSKEVIHATKAFYVEFFGGDRWIATGSRGGVLKATSLEGDSGEEISMTLGARLQGVSKAPDDRTFLVWGLSGKFGFWSPLEGELHEVPVERRTPVLDVELVGPDRADALLDRGNAWTVVSVRERTPVRELQGTLVGRETESGLGAFTGNPGVDVTELRSGETVCHLPSIMAAQVVIDRDADRVVALGVGPSLLQFWSLCECRLIASRRMESAIVGIVQNCEAREIVAWTGDGLVAVFSLETGDLSRKLNTGFAVSSVDVSEATSDLLAWNETGRAGVWSARTGAELHQLDGTGRIRTATLSSDGRTVWIARESGELQAVALVDDGLQGVFFHDDAVLGWWTLPDQELLTWAADGTARRWKVRGSDMGHGSGPGDSAFDAVALDGDAKTLFGVRANSLSAWRVARGTRIARHTAHEPIDRVVPSHDGEAVLFTAGNDVCVWTLGGDTACRRSSGSIWTAAYGESSFAVLDQRTSTLSTIGASSVRRGFVDLSEGVVRVSVFGTARALAVCRRDGGIEVHTSAARDRPAAVLAMDREITLCGGSDDQNRLLVVEADGRITILDFDPDCTTVVARWSPPDLSWQEALADYDPVQVGNAVVLRGKEGRLLWIDARSRAVVRDEVIDRGRKARAIVSERGEELLLLPDDGTSALLLDHRGNEPKRLTHLSSVVGGRFLRRGEAVATWSPDRKVRLWNTDDGLESSELPHSGIVQGVLESPDGEMLVAWTDARELVAWDPVSGMQWFEADLHDAIETVRFSRNRDCLVVELESSNPVIYPHFTRRQLGELGSGLVSRVRPFGPAEASSIDPALGQGGRGDRRAGRLGAPSLVDESLLTGWEAKAELGVLPDGGIVFVSDRPLPKILQLVEYNDFDQRLTFFSVDGELGSPVLPVPATMVSRLRREKSIIIYSLFPDHEPIGYRVPLTQH